MEAQERARPAALTALIFQPRPLRQRLSTRFGAGQTSTLDPRGWGERS